MDKLNNIQTLLENKSELSPDILELIYLIKFQIDMAQYELGDIYDVVYNFEYERGDKKNNGLYQKLIYLYEIVGDQDFYLYLKLSLLETGFSLKDILTEEILSSLPFNQEELKNVQIIESLDSILDTIYEESGLVSEEFTNIYLNALRLKYGLEFEVKKLSDL